MANVTHYSILFYGSAEGFSGNRAQIQLSDGTAVLGWIRFHDEGMAFPADGTSGDKLVMNLPTALLPTVLDVLRNEKPLKFYLAAGKVFLSTDAEEVGEEE